MDLQLVEEGLPRRNDRNFVSSFPQRIVRITHDFTGMGHVIEEGKTLSGNFDDYTEQTDLAAHEMVFGETWTLIYSGMLRDSPGGLRAQVVGKEVVRTGLVAVSQEHFCDWVDSGDLGTECESGDI
jgi:hypothetical protein